MRKSSSSKTKAGSRTTISLWLLLVAFSSLWFISVLALVSIYGLPTTAGEFGDMFGGINALFSGLALGGVIFAVLLQSKELELQRLEIRNTTKELSNQNNLISDQLKVMQASSIAERDRIVALHRPYFDWIGSGGGPEAKWKEYKFINRGGFITEPRIHTDAEVNISIVPNSIIPRSSEGKILIMSSPKPPEDYAFELHFTNEVGIFGILCFECRKGSISLIYQGPTAETLK